MGFLPDSSLFWVTKLGVGGAGRFPLRASLGPRCRGMPPGHFGHSLFQRRTRFGGWGTGVRLRNGFLNTHHRPIKTGLDFTWLAVTFCPAPLGVSFVMGLRLTPPLLAYRMLCLLLLVRLRSMIYLPGHHLQMLCEFIFLLLGWGMMPQPVKS